MITEEILYKQSRTGTTAFFFAPNVTPDMVPQLEDLAYVVFDSYGIPTEYSTYNGQEIWKLQNVNDYQIGVQLSALTTNYVTGYSISQTFNTPLPATQRATIEQRFNDNVTSSITAQTLVEVNYPTYVFFNEHLIDDMFANVKLSRTYETLDTLKIYNKPLNSIPDQEAVTGILFGKLEAIQILKDESGNNIKIPLKNVPIGIFNVSDEFPSPVSLDSNGDRFFMNLKESSYSSQYFNDLSYNEDQKFLKSASQFLTVPDKFKYITITNDNGEFVIYNVPVGNHTVVFEADLFKQGLTKDEIILNNFPFPTSDDANIGEFPCYYFNQVPVDVVSAWGTNQTGYTELNISVNLDLRKWATYIFAPGTNGNEKLEVSVAKNVKNTLKVQVRDMTNVKFAAKTLEITQIPNDLDRQNGARYLWFNEILSQRQQLEYFKFGCHVLKLPANLYDPNSFKTDENGIPTTKKGIWLSAYQFSVFINKERCFRNTGSFLDFNTNDFWSHFNINFIPGATHADTIDFAGLGKFPYEKPWSLNYPDQYKIPAKPTMIRFNYGVERTYQTPFILEEPAYSDGDLIGNIVYAPDAVAGGIGVQSINGFWLANQISLVATKDYMYKYESGVSWDEKYANGYEPYWSPSLLGPYSTVPDIAGVSSVVNGEKYQRVECGYGYFMKYQDWPRTYRIDWAADVYFGPDGGNIPTVVAPGTYDGFKTSQYWLSNTYNLDDQNYAFGFDTLKNNKLNKGTIDIYRIVKSGIDDINQLVNFVIPTYARLTCTQTSRCQDNGSVNAWRLYHQGQYIVKINFSFNSGIVFFNDGNGNSGTYINGTPMDFYPGGYFYSFDRNTIAYTSINLPGNSNYDSLINKNTAAVYRFEAGLARASTINYFGTTFSLDANAAGSNFYYINSTGTGGANGVIQRGLSDDFDYGGATYHWVTGGEYPYSIFVSLSDYPDYQGGYL